MFGNNWSAKMEGASTDKLSSHTVDEGACAELTYAVWKQWQSAIQWSGVEWKSIETLTFQNQDTDIHTLIFKLGDKTPECNGYLVRDRYHIQKTNEQASKIIYDNYNY